MKSITELVIDKSRNTKLAIFILFMSIIAIAGMHKLNLVSDYKIFFDEGNVELQTFNSFQARYGSSDNVFIFIKPDKGNIYTPQTMALIYDLTEMSWQTPFSSRVNSITNFQHTRSVGDDIFVGEFLLLKEDISPTKIDYIKKNASLEIDLVNNLITASGEETGINISLQFPGLNKKEEVSAVAKHIREIVSIIQKQYPNHKVYTSGIVMMNNAFFEIAKADFTTLIPLMVLVILFAVGAILRSLGGIAAVSAVVLVSILVSLGLAGWLGIKLSPPSISAPIILLTIVVASAIHIVSYIQRSVADKTSVEEALALSFSKNCIPVTLTHATTMIGFLTMNFSESPPFRDLGNIVALGVLVSWILSFTLLPFLIRRIPISGKKSMSVGIFNSMDVISNFVMTYKKLITYTFLPFCLVISVFSLSNSLNDDLVEYFDESVEFRKQTEIINEKFSGIYSIEYSIETNEDNGIFEPKVLSFSDEFAKWMRLQTEVMAATTISDTLKTINKNMHSGLASEYKLPESRELAAQYFLLYEMSLPFGMDMTDRVVSSKSAMRMIVRLNNMDSKKILLMESRVADWLSKNKPNNIDITYSSPAVIFAHIGEKNIRSLLVGSISALILICLILAILFRSFRIGLISILPNFLPICFAYGVWALLVGEISLGLASVSAMTIGIVVDDTVHFLYGYIRHLKEGKHPEEACRNTMREVGSAMVISSIILVLGFLILATSHFEKNALMGLLTGLTIAVALVCDLILLPILLMTFVQSKHVMDTKDRLVISTNPQVVDT